MSEFVAIIQLLGEAVQFLLVRITDVVATAFLLASCVLPWRVFYISKEFREIFPPNLPGYENSYEYWEIAARSFALTIFQLIVFPFGLISLLSPNQWFQLKRAYDSTLGTRHDDEKEMTFRIFITFWF